MLLSHVALAPLFVNDKRSTNMVFSACHVLFQLTLDGAPIVTALKQHKKYVIKRKHHNKIVN
ncbi:Hypothetical protein BN69_0739 [Methylocystis sp. SC2]|nr:Hypothetical protein BN69_0739 [Methylocystis sp. SC2]